MPKDRYMCQLCANHGIFNQPKRGHKLFCPYNKCACDLCALNSKRRALDQLEREMRTEEVAAEHASSLGITIKKAKTPNSPVTDSNTQPVTEPVTESVTNSVSEPSEVSCNPSISPCTPRLLRTERPPSIASPETQTEPETQSVTHSVTHSVSSSPTTSSIRYHPYGSRPVNASGAQSVIQSVTGYRKRFSPDERFSPATSLFSHGPVVDMRQLLVNFPVTQSVVDSAPHTSLIHSSATSSSDQDGWISEVRNRFLADSNHVTQPVTESVTHIPTTNYDSATHTSLIHSSATSSSDQDGWISEVRNRFLADSNHVTQPVTESVTHIPTTNYDSAPHSVTDSASSTLPPPPPTIEEVRALFSIDRLVTSVDEKTRRRF